MNGNQNDSAVRVERANPGAGKRGLLPSCPLGAPQAHAGGRTLTRDAQEGKRLPRQRCESSAQQQPFQTAGFFVPSKLFLTSCNKAENKGKVKEYHLLFKCRLLTKIMGKKKLKRMNVLDFEDLEFFN